MQNLLWHLVLPSLVAFSPVGNYAAVLNQPSVPMNITQPQHLTNRTLGTDVIPSDFTLEIETTRGPGLPDVFVLKGAIKVIGEHLALNDFVGRIPPQAWLYHGIVFAVSTKFASESQIQRRFVIWGISKVVQLMALDKDFRSGVSYLKFQGEIVGSLALYPVGYPSLHGSFEIDDIALLDAPISSDDSISNGSVSIGEIDLRITVLQPPVLLDLYDYLVNIMTLLVLAAQFPDGRIIEIPIFSLTCPGFDVIVIVRSIQWTWWRLIKGINSLLPTLERQRIRHYFTVQVYMGAVDIGEVSISRKSNTAIFYSRDSRLQKMV